MNSQTAEVLIDQIDQELDELQVEAEKLASQLERFHLLSFDLEIRMEHVNHLIQHDHGDFSCTCDFYSVNGTCVHIMAVELLGHASVFCKGDS